MSTERLSLLAVALATVGMVYLVFTHHLFAVGPIGMGVQILAAALMLWARLTFGGRSFHASAAPTAGGVVSHGPYRFWRHPIYASLIYFVWAGVLSAPRADALAAAVGVTACLSVRLLLEERLLLLQYPEYRTYAAHTKRLIPFLI